MGRGGERIAEIRAELGLSQADFAGRLDVARESISRWERGETEPKYEIVANAEAILVKHLAKHGSRAAEPADSYRASKPRKRGA